MNKVYFWRDIRPDIWYPARPDIRYPAKLLAGYPVAGYSAKSVSGATLILSPPNFILFLGQVWAVEICTKPYAEKT